MLCESQYTLPTIDFVGGETQDLLFHMYFHINKREFDASGCTIDFSVIPFQNKTETPVLVKAMIIEQDQQSHVYNILRVKLDAADTYMLSGKYIYQIQIKDAGNNVEIPKQGVMYITNNIHKSFITG